MTSPVRILTRRAIASLMRPNDYLQAVESAFHAVCEDRAFSPPPMHIPGIGGDFHGKGAVLRERKGYVALKLNGNFPDNPAQFGLPCIQGAIFLCDAGNGAVLAILDSMEITLRRTAAASALAANHLALKDTRCLCICGCGEQGRAHATALASVRPFEKARAWDTDSEKAARFAEAMTQELGFPVDPVTELRSAALESNVIVTCTTSREAFLGVADVSPGAFIAAVGADSPLKNEIEPSLMASAKVVVDVREQCVEMGDLRAAIEGGAMSLEDVHADLGEIVTGQCNGRRSSQEIFVFDSTGTALQDVATAAVVYERAIEAGAGVAIALGDL